MRSMVRPVSPIVAVASVAIAAVIVATLFVGTSARAGTAPGMSDPILHRPCPDIGVTWVLGNTEITVDYWNEHPCDNRLVRDELETTGKAPHYRALGDPAGVASSPH